MKIKFEIHVCLLLAVTLSSCNAPSKTLAGTPEPTLIESEASFPQPQAEHRIGIRQVNGLGEFYDKQTNERFIPRGANYVFVPAGDTYTNLLLRVNTYSPQRTRDDFSRLSSLG